MKNKLKVAVIGAGSMGKNHVRVYSEIANLTAVADVYDETGKAVAAQYGVNFYKDFLKLLDKEKPDAVSVAVPTAQHKEVVLECLNRKIPTLVEKPIAVTIKDAREMIRFAKKAKTILMVGHIERFNPAVIKLKQLIDEKRFGRLISLLSIRVGVAPPRVSNSDVVLDLGIHDIDVFNWLIGSLPNKKNIIKNKLFTKNIADSAAIILEYNSVKAIIQTNWITPIKMRKLYVTGAEGFAEIDYISQKVILYDKLLNVRPDGDFFEVVAFSDTPKREVYVSKKEPLKEELTYFLNAVKNKQSIDTRHALDALELIMY